MISTDDCRKPARPSPQSIDYYRLAADCNKRTKRGRWNVRFGDALRRTGRLREAETVFQDALATTDLDQSELYTGLAAIRLQQNRYREAAEFAHDALKTKPAKIRALYFLGLAFMRGGNAPGAIRAFQEYARLQPDRIAPYRHLERLTRDSGDDAQADAYNIKTREMLENRRLLRFEKKKHTSK